MNHYTYYSYEEWGRGYTGARSCQCLPEEDIKYFGSFKDKTFRPTQKIILREDYDTREECISDEVLLHAFYEVDVNPHFSNLARQTSTKFDLPIEKKRENGIKTGTRMKEEKFGVCGRSKEKMSEDGRKAGLRSYEVKAGVHKRTKEEMSEHGKMGGNKAKEEGKGIHALTQKELIYFAKIGGEKAKENKTGIHAETTEQRSERMKEINTQRWMCLETNFVSSPSGLTTYQKNRGIDTTKRIRIS